MGFLTDRAFITGFSLSNLVHVVDINDTSQGNPDGSSYKGSIQQLFDLYTNYSGNSFVTTTGVTVSDFTATTSYCYYGVTYIGDTNITIPSPSGITGSKITIKDERGTASTYRIRVITPLGLIDGNTYIDMNINFMSLTLVARNNNWWII